MLGIAVKKALSALSGTPLESLYTIIVIIIFVRKKISAGSDNG